MIKWCRFEALKTQSKNMKQAIAERGPKCDVNTAQGTDWVKFVTKDECKSFTKTKTTMFKCPSYRILHFHLLKT